jgi:hypothetical protein
MRKLVLILIAFIAAVTFIRAYDNSSNTGAELAETVISSEMLD